MAWCRRGLVPGSQQSWAYRELMQVATEYRGLAIVTGTPAAIRGRGPGLGSAAPTATAPAWPLAGAARREQPSPGAQASAEQREADEREEITCRGVGNAHLPLSSPNPGRRRLPQHEPPWGTWTHPHDPCM